MLGDSALQVSHLFWAGGFTGSDGRSYKESVEDATEALHTAAQIHADTLVVYSGGRGGHTANHARRLIEGALGELIPTAVRLGITLALEPMHPGCADEFTFLTSLDDTVSLIESVGNPRVKMVLDTYHLGQDAGLVEQIPEIAQHVVLVQLGDARQPPEGEQNRCRLGEGMVPLQEIVDGLKGAGYDGYYDVELLGEDVETADYHSLLTHARNAFEKLVEPLGG